MDEALIEAVLDRVREKLQEGLPTALLIGRRPEADLGYRYVNGPPYTAVVIGSLQPGELLCRPPGRTSCVPVHTWASRKDQWEQKSPGFLWQCPSAAPELGCAPDGRASKAPPDRCPGGQGAEESGAASTPEHHPDSIGQGYPEFLNKSPM